MMSVTAAVFQSNGARLADHAKHGHAQHGHAWGWTWHDHAWNAHHATAHVSKRLRQPRANFATNASPGMGLALEQLESPGRKEQHDEAGWNFKVKNMCSRFVESHDLLKTMVSCHAIPPCFQLSRSHFWPFLAISGLEFSWDFVWLLMVWHIRAKKVTMIYDDLWLETWRTFWIHQVFSGEQVFTLLALCHVHIDHNTISLSPPSPRTSFARPWKGSVASHKYPIDITTSINFSKWIVNK